MHLCSSKSMEKQGQSESERRAGKKSPAVGRTGALLHLLDFGFVIRVVAHFAHPRFSEKKRRVPQESHHYRGYRGYQNREPIQLVHVHGETPLYGKSRKRLAVSYDALSVDAKENRQRNLSRLAGPTVPRLDSSSGCLN